MNTKPDIRKHIEGAAEKPIFLWVLIGCLGVLGISVIIYSTVWGAALSDDSYYYIHAARDLLSGHGYTMTPHFPPTLPLVLSLIGVVGIDPLEGVRWLNALLFGINIVLMGMLVHELTLSWLLSIFSAVFFLLADTLIMVHAWAMSEGLYLTFLLLGFLAGAEIYPRRRWMGVILLACGFGLAAATRYVGVSLLLAGGSFFLLEAKQSWKTRLQNAFTFGAVSILPIALWAIRNQILIGRPTSRTLEWHPIPASLWIKVLNTIFLWIAPGRLVHDKELYWLTATLLLVIFGLFYKLWRDRWGFQRSMIMLYQNRAVFLIGLSIVFYWLILVISKSWLDTAIPMDQRLLSPVLVMSMILLGWILAQAWFTGNGLRRRGLILVVLCSALMIVNSTRSIKMVLSYHELGRGYASARDHISETYAYLRNRPDVPVYSNAFAAIYFWTGRDTFSLPPRDGLATMKTDMQRNGALLVIFDSIPLELYNLTETEVTEGLAQEIRLSESTIYRYPEATK